MVLWHLCWGNWKDWRQYSYFYCPDRSTSVDYMSTQQCCQELQKFLSKESSLLVLLIDSSVASEVMEHHPEDFHVSAFFVVGRKWEILGKVYSLHLKIFPLAVELGGRSVSDVEGLKGAVCFILYHDALGPGILNFPPIHQAIYLVIGVETIFLPQNRGCVFLFLYQICAEPRK